MIPNPKSPWLNPPDKTAVFLIDTSSKLEREIVDRWISSTKPASAEGNADFEMVFLHDWAEKKSKDRFAGEG